MMDTPPIQIFERHLKKGGFFLFTAKPKSEERYRYFMANLKSDWKKTGKEIGDAFKSIGDDSVNTGKSFGHAFRDLGKSIIKSAKIGVDKAVEWANTEDESKETD